MATSLLVTKTYMKNTLQLLEKRLYIYYLLYFWKDPHETKALINLDNEVNDMTPAYIAKLGLKIQKTNIKT